MIDVKGDILGITIHYEDYQDAHLHVLKVNTVHKDGPASDSGLQAQTDFILGAKSSEKLAAASMFDVGFTKFEGLHDFATFVTEYESSRKPLTLCIYSTETEKVRDVLITPNARWGGNGMLGCDVVQGQYSKIPTRRKNLWAQHTEIQK